VNGTWRGRDENHLEEPVIYKAIGCQFAVRGIRCLGDVDGGAHGEIE